MSGSAGTKILSSAIEYRQQVDVIMKFYHRIVVNIKSVSNFKGINLIYDLKILINHFM